MKILLALFVLYNSSNAVIIQCTYRIGNFNQFLPNVYYCEGSILSFENSSIITDIRGQHTAGRDNSYVAAIYVAKSPDAIPYGIGAIFPNLLAFQWENALVRSFRAEDLKQFPNLISINLANQWIESLDGDSFKFTPKLKLMSFNSNQLRNVGYDLLTSLPDLVYVDLRSNICIDSFAQNVQAVQALRDILPVNCPPLSIPTTTTISTTTTENVCDVRCSINEEADKLRHQVNELKNKLAEQSEINAKSEERFSELEAQVREILAGS